VILVIGAVVGARRHVQLGDSLRAFQPEGQVAGVAEQRHFEDRPAAVGCARCHFGGIVRMTSRLPLRSAMTSLTVVQSVIWWSLCRKISMIVHSRLTVWAMVAASRVRGGGAAILVEFGLGACKRG